LLRVRERFWGEKRGLAGERKKESNVPEMGRKMMPAWKRQECHPGKSFRKPHAARQRHRAHAKGTESLDREQKKVRDRKEGGQDGRIVRLSNCRAYKKGRERIT